MAWWNDLFAGFNTTGENKEPEVEPLIEKLKKKGYEWDEGLESWVRIWTTNNGDERVLEVYKQFQEDDISGWKVTMIGNDGNVFYEEKI